MRVAAGGTDLWFDVGPGDGRLAVVPGAGHVPWLDAPETFWPTIETFVRDVAARDPQTS